MVNWLLSKMSDKYLVRGSETLTLLRESLSHESNCFANVHFAYLCLLILANLMEIDLLRSLSLCILPFVQEYKGLSVGE